MNFIECADQTGCGLGNDGISCDYQTCISDFFMDNKKFNRILQ